MIEQIYTFFTIEMLYYWVNLGILPFWLVLICFPRSHISRIFVTSIFPIFILSGTNIFMIYKSFEGSFSYSQQQVSEKLGISRVYINNTIEKFIKNLQTQ